MRIVTDFSVTSAPLRSQHGWHPGWLFRGGAPGGWYDPSDPTTTFSDLIGVDPAGSGDPVGLALDKSGNGYHATQGGTASRPICGVVPETGRRNRLTQTETLANPWTISQAAMTVLVGGVVRLTPNTSEAQHYAVLSGFTVWDDSQVYTHSVELKAADPDLFRFVRFHSRTKEPKFPNVTVDLTTGDKAEGIGLISTTVTALENDWWRITLTADAGTGSAVPQFGIFPSTGFSYGAITFAGDGVASLLIRKPQAETGSTATAYQKVTSQYVVTEAGERSLPYLYRDGVDDALNATLPDLGTDATVAYANDQGVTILAGQTIGAGAYDVLRDEKLFGLVVVDRALSAAETARLAEWLEQKAGAFA